MVRVLVLRLASAILALVASAGAGQAAAPGTGDCAYDEAALLALGYRDFDQDLTPGGWRAVAARPGCSRAAAALIARWREAHGQGLSPGELQVLWWHEGQVLATAGDYDAAIERLLKARTFRDERPPPPGTPAEEAEMQGAMTAVQKVWEEATIAFLRRDRAALEAARARMLAVPEPGQYAKVREAFRRQTGVRMAWPLNIEGVERMAACFDHPYGFECRPEKTGPPGS